LARSEASGLRSSWLASAKNRRVICWLASRSAIEVSIRASIPFSAAPRRPTSVLVSGWPTRSVRSPAVIRSASSAMVSMGRRPRRISQATPRPATSAAATEPMVRIIPSRSTVLFTAARLVLAISRPPATGTVCSRSWTRPLRLTTVRKAGTGSAQDTAPDGIRSGLPCTSRICVAAEV
jgi:hypothetical protein